MNDQQPVNSKEQEFVFNGFRYAAKMWGDGDIPIIALHGWLDNCASFDVIAPLLCEALDVTILAPDLAGHGLSEHRNGFTDYPLWSEIMPIYAMADELGWEQFILIGHSRGAMISSLVASVYPERVKQIILIDAVTATVADPANSFKRLKSNIHDMQRRMQRRLSTYPNYDAAIKARTKSDVTKVDEVTAKRLAVRGLSEVDGGYNWHTDDKLWGGCHFSLPPEQVKEYVSKIQAEILILFGKFGFKEMYKKNVFLMKFTDEIIEFMSADVQYFDDGHYLHMQKSAEEVAESIIAFIGNFSGHQASIKISKQSAGNQLL